MKKHHWHVFWHEKLFEKHLQPHCQTRFLKAQTTENTIKVFSLYVLKMFLKKFKIILFKINNFLYFQIILIYCC